MIIRVHNVQFTGIPKQLLPPVAGKGRLLEMDPVVVELPVQVLIYSGEQPDVYEGSALNEPDGSTTINLPIIALPARGTPIQVLLYQDSGRPTIVEGVTTGASGDGSISIEIPDELLQERGPTSPTSSGGRPRAARG